MEDIEDDIIEDEILDPNELGYLKIYIDELLLDIDEYIYDIWEQQILPTLTNVYNKPLFNKLNEGDYWKFAKLMREKSEIYNDLINFRNNIN